MFLALLKSSFSSHSVILCGSYEGNPLSPPEGEAACGEHPPAPLFFRSVIFNLIRDYRNKGDDESGGGGSTMGWSTQERLIVSIRVSTKPFFCNSWILCFLELSYIDNPFEPL
jgi:hypothetical protein